jgi:hypothetical protein
MPTDPPDYYDEVASIRAKHPNCIDIDDVDYSKALAPLHDRIDNQLDLDEAHFNDIYTGSGIYYNHIAYDLAVADSRHPHQRTTLLYY